MLTHDGFDERGEPLEDLECMVCSWAVLEVCKGLDEDVGHGQWVVQQEKVSWVDRKREVYKYERHSFDRKDSNLRKESKHMVSLRVCIGHNIEHDCRVHAYQLSRRRNL